MNPTLIAEIDAVVREIANVDHDDSDLTPEVDLLGEGFIDSMKFLKLILTLERTHSVKFTDGDIAQESITTIVGLAAALQAKRDAQGAPA